MFDKKTIVAQASAAGTAGIAVIRLSGNKSKQIANQLFKKSEENITARHAYFASCYDRKNNLLDECLFIFFESPKTFTGEDIVEIQCHGSPIVINNIINECCTLGARLAKPGEFSERAFLNGKIDLVQAEAIADLISAQSETAAKNALASLKGVFSNKINEINKDLIDTRCYLEAAIDFPDEEGVDFVGEGKIKDKTKRLAEKLENIIGRANQGLVYQEGISVVLAGEPNAGKSSLLNQLAKTESAIVTEIPGTTRDVLKENINIQGIPIKIIDTAGIRQSVDPVEKEGIKRALKEIEEADFIFYIFDSERSQPFFEEAAWHIMLEDKEDISKRVVVIINKIDLSLQETRVEKIAIDGQEIDQVFISAKTGEGVDLLESLITKKLNIKNSEEGLFAARRRHILALKEAQTFLKSAIETLELKSGDELAAEDLRLAHRALGEITGEFSPDDLLGTIFSSFCIGK